MGDRETVAAPGTPTPMGTRTGTPTLMGTRTAMETRTPMEVWTAEGGAPTGQLIGTVRDFHDTHPDFESNMGTDRGFVGEDLGTDGKPVYVGGAGTTTTTGEDNFDQWFNDVPGVNTTAPLTIELENDGTGLFVYDDQEFFPIDDELFGNEGNPHNYHFTFELHTEFTYKGGEVFRFIGDDDLFVFINGKLAIDLGGVHVSESAEADLDLMQSELGIAEGSVYPLDFFFAERHTVASHFRVETTISDLSSVVIK